MNRLDHELGGAGHLLDRVGDGQAAEDDLRVLGGLAARWRALESTIDRALGRA